MQFKTDPERFNEIRNRVIIVMSIVSVVILALVTGSGVFSEGAEDRQASLITVAFLAIVIAGTVAFVLKSKNNNSSALF